MNYLNKKSTQNRLSMWDIVMALQCKGDDYSRVLLEKMGLPRLSALGEEERNEIVNALMAAYIEGSMEGYNVVNKAAERWKKEEEAREMGMQICYSVN